MKFISTRGKSAPVGFFETLEQSLADDGGLFVPEKFPVFDPSAFPSDRKEIGKRVLAPFLDQDPRLGAICDRAFDFEIPLRFLRGDTAVLELFHGPTAAFKDVGARFLAECIAALNAEKPRARTVLVATSGDTGGAVAAAFFGQPGVEVIILYPRGKISPRQERQLTAWGGNVRAFAARGTFDDCQRIAKEALRDAAWSAGRHLISANSISLGRLLPQTVYYAASSLAYFRETGHAPGFIVPSGNLGNSVAALWAKRMGFPIRQVMLATNANAAVEDYFRSGKIQTHATVVTLANAMDVGNPSNLERLAHLYPRLEDLARDSGVLRVSDEEISAAIAAGPAQWGEVWCPHTATAVQFREKLASPHWIVVATAHPAKFDTIVEPLIGRAVEIPPSLHDILAKPSVFQEIEPDFASLRRGIASPGRVK